MFANIIKSFVFLSFIPFSAIYAADEELKELDDNSMWVYIGFLGKTFSEEIDGVGVVSGISFSNRNNLYSIRRTTYNDGRSRSSTFTSCLIIFFSCGTGKVVRIEELGLLYGRLYFGGKLSVSAGISKVTRENSFDDIDNYSINGIPIEIQLRLFKKYTGIGIIIIGNINSEQSFLGAYLNVQFGKM